LDIERLAQKIHENYLVTYAPGGPSWDELSEDLRENNRDQARAIVSKLASVGARVEPGPQTTPFAFTAPELERLAQAEHRRWVAQRRASGWIYAAVRDNRRKRHPMIIKWDKLSEREREKDRDAVRNIPSVLNSAGLRVVRGWVAPVARHARGPRPHRVVP
jgi:hypothetical protein